MDAWISRQLLPYACQRLRLSDIILVYQSKQLQADGSFRVTELEDAEKGYFTQLTTTEIQKLREGGMSITSGAQLTLSTEIEKIPDQVKHRKGKDGIYRDISRVIQYSRGEGITNLILDTSTMRQL